MHSIASLSELYVYQLMKAGGRRGFRADECYCVHCTVYVTVTSYLKRPERTYAEDPKENMRKTWKKVRGRPERKYAEDLKESTQKTWKKVRGRPERKYAEDLTEITRKTWKKVCGRRERKYAEDLKESTRKTWKKVRGRPERKYAENLKESTRKTWKKVRGRPDRNYAEDLKESMRKTWKKVCGRPERKYAEDLSFIDIWDSSLVSAIEEGRSQCHATANCLMKLPKQAEWGCACELSADRRWKGMFGGDSGDAPQSNNVSKYFCHKKLEEHICWEGAEQLLIYVGWRIFAACRDHFPLARNYRPSFREN